MRAWLVLSQGIDAMNRRVAHAVRWLILLTVLISAGNAMIRKAFRFSSNAFLEVQWYLFAVVFLLCAGYVFLRNAHVRVDFVSSRLSARARAWIDAVGIVVFLIPFCLLLIDESWPLVVDAWRSGETSPNAGGLVRWPVYLLLPVGMALLLLQALSELIKRLAFLRGAIPDPVQGASVQVDAAESARTE
jgi:TRAP-type mannitol/chloroaromatic compound transport system permease small subunit